MKCDLSGPLDGKPLPQGFTVRHSRGEPDARFRSAASSAAFASNKPFDEYVSRTLRFMRSEVYIPEHEIFVVAPDGRLASFCVIWTDSLNRAGQFEPVGTHPDFQGKGCGKSVLFEGLRRLKSEGMNDAFVCVKHDNMAALNLYKSTGFQNVKRLLTFIKKRK